MGNRQFLISQYLNPPISQYPNPEFLTFARTTHHTMPTENHPEDFLSLRMFTDAEVQTAVREVFGHPAMLAGMRKLLPEALCQQLLDAHTTVVGSDDFQVKMMVPFLAFVEQASMDALTHSGLEGLNAEQPYLFISNHRDIGLDSAFINTALYQHGLTTTQIAIGDNLMTHRLAALIFKINKSFAVLRSGTPRELYGHSVRMSAYIHSQVQGHQSSVWIAQREGRAKDGNDFTQVGLLKMLSLSAAEPLGAYFRSLRIVPVSISYEYDPTDLAKTLTHLHKLHDPTYKKPVDEDVQHILMGIMGHKGRVHIHFGAPLGDAEAAAMDALPTPKQQLDCLAKYLDRQIHAGYALRPINYYACDQLLGTEACADRYTAQEAQALGEYFDTRLGQLPQAQQGLGREYLLAMYANPVKNALKHEETTT